MGAGTSTASSTTARVQPRTPCPCPCPQHEGFAPTASTVSTISTTSNALPPAFRQPPPNVHVSPTNNTVHIMPPIVPKTEYIQHPVQQGTRIVCNIDLHPNGLAIDCHRPPQTFYE